MTVDSRRILPKVDTPAAADDFLRRRERHRVKSLTFRSDYHHQVDVVDFEKQVAEILHHLIEKKKKKKRDN